MNGMSNRELRGRLRTGGLPEPPADLLARLKSEIPDDLAVGGDGLRLAARQERPRVFGIRQVTLLAASLLVVVGTGFLAFTVLAPERSFLDRTAYDKVPEAYVVTVPPRIFVAGKQEHQIMAVQSAPALAKGASGTARQPVVAEEKATVITGAVGDDRAADSLGALRAENATETARALRDGKAVVAAGAAPGAVDIVVATAPAVALPSSPGLGAGSPAAEKDLPEESRKTTSSVVDSRQEADAAGHQASDTAGRTRADAVALAEASTDNQARPAPILREEKLDQTAAAPAPHPASTHARRLQPEAAGRSAVEKTTGGAVPEGDQWSLAGRVAAGQRVSLTVMPAGDGIAPALVLRDPQGRPVAAARVTFTAMRDGRILLTRSDRDGVVRAALAAGEYHVEIRTAAASEPVIATLHADPAGWHLAPHVPVPR